MARGVDNETRDRRTEWITHNEVWLIPALLAMAGVMGFAGVPFWAGLGVGLPVMWFVQYHAGRHDVIWCSRCLARNPRDPQAAVNRHRRALRWAHWVSSWRGLALCGVGLAGMFSPWPYTRLAGLAGLLVLLGVTSRCRIRHKQLDRWCPHCYPDGGGWEPLEAAPDPVPVPVGVKQR